MKTIPASIALRLSRLCECTNSVKKNQSSNVLYGCFNGNGVKRCGRCTCRYKFPIGAEAQLLWAYDSVTPLAC